MPPFVLIDIFETSEYDSINDNDGFCVVQAEIIYNPYSGQVIVRDELIEAADLLRKNGWTVDIREVHKPLESIRLARDAVARGADVVIAAGGDGTVGEVANALVGTDTALGVLPVGTTNVWALQMHIPALNPVLLSTSIFKWITKLKHRLAKPLPIDHYRKVILNAAQVLIDGQTVKVDVGQVGDRYFLMWMGIGWDAGVMQKITTERKRNSGSLAYLMPALGSLGHYWGNDISMTIDGEETRVNSPLIVISNIQLYAGVLRIGARACVNDGRLDVCVFKGKGFFAFLRHVVSVFFRRHTRDRQVEYHQCRRIEILSDASLPVHIDGDPVTFTPVFVSVVPQALKVIVPRKAPKNLFTGE